MTNDNNLWGIHAGSNGEANTLFLKKNRIAIDVLCLAHAEQLGIPVVTDDEEMREAAGDYGIKVLKTLELLKLMLDSGYIDMPKIREIVGYWEYQNDKPKDFKKDYKRIFGEEPPK